MENTTLHLPSTWKRLGALFIDGLVLGLPTGFCFLVGIYRIGENEVFFPFIPYILSAVAALGFQFYFLKKFSTTVGKMALGLVVTDAKTLRPGLTTAQALLRLFSGFLALIFSLAPMAYALVREDRRQISDIIAGTQVMQKTPRKKAPKKRWIIGSVVMVYFVFMGPYSSYNSWKSLRWHDGGFSMPVRVKAEVEKAQEPATPPAGESAPATSETAPAPAH